MCHFFYCFITEKLSKNKSIYIGLLGDFLFFKKKTNRHLNHTNFIIYSRRKRKRYK